MTHAVALRCEHLPPGAVPVYEIDNPCRVLYLDEKGNPSSCRLNTEKRFFGQKHGIETFSVEELRKKFLGALHRLVLAAGHGGVIAVAFINDVVIFGEKPIYKLGFATMLVADEPEEPLIYRSFVMNMTTPEHLDLTSTFIE